MKRMIYQNARLFPAFAGVWSADNFPKQPVWNRANSDLGRKTYSITDRLVWFQIVNTSPVQATGKHWLLLGAVSSKDQKKMTIFVWDCLGNSLSKYKVFFSRFKQFYKRTGFTEISLTLQNNSSNMCGLYCLFLIQYIAKKPFDLSFSKEKFKGMTEIDIIRYINDEYKTLFRYTVV